MVTCVCLVYFCLSAVWILINTQIIPSTNPLSCLRETGRQAATLTSLVSCRCRCHLSSFCLAQFCFSLWIVTSTKRKWPFGCWKASVINTSDSWKMMLTEWFYSVAQISFLSRNPVGRRFIAQSEGMYNLKVLQFNYDLVKQNLNVVKQMQAQQQKVFSKAFKCSWINMM